MTTELFALGLFEFAACFLVAIAAIASGPLVADTLTLHFSAALAVCIVLVSLAVGSYRCEAFLLLRRIAFKSLLAILFALIAGSAVVWLADGSETLSDQISRQALSRGTLACLALLFVVRLVFGYAYRLGAFTRRLVVLGDEADAELVRDAVEREVGSGLEVVGRFNPDTDPDELARQCNIRGIWGVVATPTAPDSAAAIATASATRLIACADLWETFLHRINLNTLRNSVTMRARAHPLSAALHRLVDIMLSLGLLSFALPLMVGTAIGIRLESRGPVLYRQERVGLGGKPFTLVKFRSMRTDAEASGPVWAAARDNRVTRIGGFIRLTRIDELPQLFNILRGEMSFIGPRPERPVFVAQLEKAIPFYADRAQVKPGLTGWAQVNYPYGASVEDARMKLSYDLYYVKHQSILLDIMILFATIRVILFQEGAR